MSSPGLATDSIILRAPAKVNLYLAVGHLRSDGYHEIASCMQMVGLYDRLTFRPHRTDLRLTVESSPLSADRSNLVYRAAQALRQAAAEAGRQVGGAAITLEKNIPIAAGLGGGSSDAAATLIGLNRLWNLRWRHKRLAELSATIGSDIPFFFYGPTAWVTGRGECVTPMTSPPCDWAVVVDPEQPVETASVYAQLSRRAPTHHPMPMPRLALDGDFSRIFARPRNDLERVTLARFPHHIQIKKTLRRFGGQGVLMSGSGATFFGLFERADCADAAAAAIRQKEMGRAWTVRLLKRSPR